MDNENPLPPPPKDDGAAKTLRNNRRILASIAAVVVLGVGAWLVLDRSQEPSTPAKEACGGLQASGMLFNLMEGSDRTAIAMQMYNNALIGLDADEGIIRARARAVANAGDSGSGVALNRAIDAFLEACVDIGLDP